MSALFATRLRALRAKANMTQVQLAQALAVANGTIAMWETEKREPDIKTILRISNYFGVTTDYLIGEGKPDKYSSEFCERLSCELEIIRGTLAGDEPVMEDFYRLEDFAANPHLMSLFEACEVAAEVSVSVGYLLGEEDVDASTPEGTKKSPGSEDSEPRDDLEKEFISLVKQLRPSQKAFLLSLLKTIIEQDSLTSDVSTPAKPETAQ